jgi:uncharacterized peroxidase-related enzyme
MSRITTPATIDASPEASRPLLTAVNKQIGFVPNLFRILGTSPVALEGFLGLSGALSRGKLKPPTRERIALAIAEINGCNYCLAAHNHFAKLGDAEVAANRNGTSTDAHAAAAVAFAVKIATARGAVDAEDVLTVRAAGYSDAEIVEIIAHVALNTLTNYVNEVLDTEIDFPVLNALAA